MQNFNEVGENAALKESKNVARILSHYFENITLKNETRELATNVRELATIAHIFLKASPVDHVGNT